MTEQAVIERVETPVTADDIAADLRALGVDPGETLIVHSSMSALGWVAGQQQAVVEGLQRAVTEKGTLVVPTHSPQFSDSANWSNPPVPDAWVEEMPERMPPFRPAATPSRGVGAVPECFRTYPDAVRSRHPEYSFAAWGADAEAVVADHSYDNGLGEGSPLAEVYDRAGRVLLLGVGHSVNTSLHLAEYRADFEKGRVCHRAPVVEDGERVVVEYADIVTETADFEDAGAAFESEVGVAVGTVGAGDVKLLDQRELVDFAAEWFEARR
ncbi:aminoglycoside N(3)-acetyltransferase [Natronomonas amylolytica]|uniref:aminoglycoside N(3)-acetyltransferase n=1 Tax=Natronomonas amylolytica TaxID=3108498 RepID=UPI0030095A37